MPEARAPLLSLDELTAMGFRLVLSPLSLLYSATTAMQQAAAHLRDHGTLRDRVGGLVGFDEFAHLVGADRDDLLEARYRSERVDGGHSR